MNRKPKVGTWVRLIKGRSKKRTHVIGYVHGVRGGILLNDRLDGFFSWNMRDVYEVPAPRSKPSRSTREERD